MNLVEIEHWQASAQDYPAAAGMSSSPTLTPPRVFRSLFSKSGSDFRILVLGLDATGKTTLLYALKLGKVITTIPTIGFNVESFILPTSHGILQTTCWDVGGCDKIRPLWRHYFQNTQGAIFMVDSSDPSRLDEGITECGMIQNELIRDNPSCDVPILIFANKQDLPKAMSVHEIRSKFIAQLPHPENVAVFGISAISPDIAITSKPAFDWLLGQVSLPGRATPAIATTETQEKSSKVETSSFHPRSPETLADKLESWIKRLETDSSPQEFLDQFNQLDLPSWDHYTHIRLAFIILTTYGRQKGKNMIFDGIENYIANSGKTTGRAFHITMTYFWIQMVHFGIRQTPPPVTSDSTSKLTADDFGLYVILNPQVADGNLWEDYYSREVIMTAKAKEEMVLPDKKPLPNIVPREMVRN